MSPASHTHAQIYGNAYAVVSTSIDAAGLDLPALVGGAVIPGLQPGRNVRVPDIVVTAAPDLPGQVAIPQPILVIEILSPGNQKQTRDNLRSYASVPAMQEIVLVHSQRVLAEVQRRGADGTWATDTVGPGSELALATVALRRPVEALYRRTWLTRP